MISNCTVCDSGEGKYKCVSCHIPFCSVNCGKTHKESGNCYPIKETEPLADVNTSRLETEDTIPPEIMAQLGDNKQLKEMLQNKDLRQIIDAVDRAEDGGTAVRQAMCKEESFNQFVDLCLQIVSPTEKS